MQQWDVAATRARTHRRARAHLTDVLLSVEDRKERGDEMERWRDRMRLVSDPDTFTCGKATCEPVGCHHTNTHFTLMDELSHFSTGQVPC